MRLRTDGNNIWAEERIGRWLARGRIVAQGGRLVVAELRMEPIGGLTPPGGVTQAVVRSVPLGRFGPYVEAYHSFPRASGIGGLREHFDKTIGAALPALGQGEALQRPRPRRASGRDDLFYARLAEQYLAAIRDGSRSPIKTLAKARRKPAARVRDMLHEARVRDLLSKGEAGRVGGTLRPRARALLKGGGK